MSCLAYIYSVKDCRPIPLFPCICGDDGSVPAFGAESFTQRTHHVCIEPTRHAVPVYCRHCIGYYADPYPHYSCLYLGCYCDEGTCCAYPHYCQVYCGCWCDPDSAHPHYECVCIGECYVLDEPGCSYDVKYMEINSIPAELKRLGPKSRAAVMSLYRAIIERFYIMRATGCDCTRPVGDTFGGFGFDATFLKDNACSDKRALAGENRRRAFGGTFRDTMRTIINGAYQATGEPTSKCDVVFYPFTPYAPRVDFSPTFLPCAKDLGDNPITWWSRQQQNLESIVGSFCGNSHEALWVLDNMMQPDIVSRHCQGCRRPLLRDVIAAYREFMRSDDHYACGYLDVARCRELPDDRLKSFSNTFSIQSLTDCNIWNFTDAINRFFEPCDPQPPRFWLPALGLALRMLSPINVQTVSRGSTVTIPHKRITANFTLPLGVVDRHFVVGQERSCFKICDITLGCAITCARLDYTLGNASYRTLDFYYNFDCREWPPEFCTCTITRPRYACVCIGCYCDECSPAYPHYCYDVYVGCYGDPYRHYCRVYLGCYGDPYRHYCYPYLGCYCDEGTCCAYPHYDCVYCGCYCDPDSAYPHYDCVYCGCYCDPDSAYPHYDCVFCGCHPDPYPHYGCRCVGVYTCGYIYPNPNYSYIPAECAARWAVRTHQTGSEGSLCASVTMSAIWPDLSGTGFQFGGAAYPARWAVRECDIAFGAVSGFVKGRNCNERAWVVNATTNAKNTLGSCKDLMTVLGRGIIRSGIKRAILDQAGSGVCGNTFSGVNFPTTQAAITREMVGDSHAENLRVIRCAAGRSGGGDGDGVGGGLYHHLRVAGCGAIFGYPDAEETGGGEELFRSSLWSDGKWLRLGTSGGGSIAFSYDSDYFYCGDGGSCCSGSGVSSICGVRHGWNLPRASVQFGGFFGTFRFNNRAAKQL